MGLLGNIREFFTGEKAQHAAKRTQADPALRVVKSPPRITEDRTPTDHLGGGRHHWVSEDRRLAAERALEVSAREPADYEPVDYAAWESPPSGDSGSSSSPDSTPSA